MQVKVWSRPGVGDDCDCGHYEYNGSFEAPDGALAEFNADVLEGWAKMIDAFQEVLFQAGNHILPYSRTWING